MFYVYEWYNKQTNEIFYVGKGCRNRYKQITKRNKLFTEYLSEHDCDCRRVKYFETEKSAFEYEHKRICELKQKNQCSCNLDNGGIGGVNFIWTNEMREYYSKYNVMKNENQRKRMSEKNPMKNSEISKKVNAKKSKPIFIGYKRYNSLKEAATEYQTTQSNILYWLNIGKRPKSNDIVYYEGKTPNKYLSKMMNKYKPIIYDGVRYEKIKDLAEQLGISSSIICNHLKNGFMPNGKALRCVGDNKEYIFYPQYDNHKKFIPIIVNGKEYKCIKYAANELKISPNTIQYALKNPNSKSKYKCEYVNQQPSHTKSDNSSVEGSTTNE